MAVLPPDQQLVFDEVTERIHNDYGDLGFQPSMVCIITWIAVHPYAVYNMQDKVD